MENRNLDSIIFEHISKDTELDLLAEQSIMYRRVVMSDKEFEFYIETLSKHENYNHELPLSKYMACKDMITYFKSDVQPQSKN